LPGTDRKLEKLKTDEEKKGMEKRREQRKGNKIKKDKGDGVTEMVAGVKRIKNG
jgi:hypothetical protein